MTPTAFARLYEEGLTPVWQYVRSRGPDDQEAEDVTSEIFVKAWQSSGGYDSTRGSPRSWLFGIARHAVADWWGEAGSRHIASTAGSLPALRQEGTTTLTDEPEETLLSQEALDELRRGFGLLKERERDALALRFAGGLKVAEVGQVLGLTVGAAQMLLHRALHRLAALLEEEVPAEGRSRSLEELVRAAVDRHPQATADPHLRSLLMHLAALHQPPVPGGLKRRIDACLACYPPDPTVRQERSTMTLRSLLSRAGISSIPGLGAAVAVPACVTCTLPGIVPTLAALGLLGPATLFHNLMLATWPVFLWVVWRNYRVHRQPVGLWLMIIGGLLLLVHSFAHFVTEGAGHLAFDGPNRAGNLFIIGGLVADYGVRIRGYLRHRALQRAMELQPGGVD